MTGHAEWLHDLSRYTRDKPGTYRGLQSAPFQVLRVWFLRRGISQMMPKTVGIEELQERTPPRPIIGPVKCVCRLGQGTHDRVLSGLPRQPRLLRRPAERLQRMRGLSDIRGWRPGDRLGHEESSIGDDAQARQRRPTRRDRPNNGRAAAERQDRASESALSAGRRGRQGSRSAVGRRQLQVVCRSTSSASAGRQTSQDSRLAACAGRTDQQRLQVVGGRSAAAARRLQVDVVGGRSADVAGRFRRGKLDFAGRFRRDTTGGRFRRGDVCTASAGRRRRRQIGGRSAASARRLQGGRQGDGSPSSRKVGRRIVAASLNVAGRFRSAASQDGAAGRRRRVRRHKVGRRKAGQTLDLPSRFALIPCGRETPRERGRRRLGFWRKINRLMGRLHAT